MHVVSPAGIPSADEALRTLITRFRSESAPSVFAELAGALLARGHATEALKVAEHGLESAPTHVEGRVERAAALLALGRPKIAYVELRRVLALDPRNRRALRLLGQTYKDSGVPERAAQLLARRLVDEPEGELEVTAVTKAPDLSERTSRDPEIRRPSGRHFPSERPETPTEAVDLTSKALSTATLPPPSLYASPPPSRPSSSSPTMPDKSSPVGDLFSELTKDLGLGAAVPEMKVRNVEVTQIIRRRGPARPPRTDSELVAIEGPIVDKTQPGGNFEVTDDIPRLAVAPKEPMAMNEPSNSTAELPFGSYSFDDEPLYQEALPFAIRPVETEVDQEPVRRSPAPRDRDHSPPVRRDVASPRDRDRPPPSRHDAASPRDFESAPQKRETPPARRGDSNARNVTLSMEGSDPTSSSLGPATQLISPDMQESVILESRRPPVIAVLAILVIVVVVVVAATLFTAFLFSGVRPTP